MAIYQTDTNDVPANSFLAFFRTIERTKLYDLLTCAPLVIWYVYGLTIEVPRLARQFTTLDLATVSARDLAGLISSLATQIFFVALVALMVLRHQPLGKTSSFYPRFAAVAGTFLSITIVILPLRELSVAMHVVSTLLIVGGIGFALYALLWLGRSLSMLPEARRLVTSGPYRVIRHPLYLGEAIALVGVTLQYLSPWAVGLLALQCVFQLERMRYEELVLSSVFPEYRDYAARTARLLPGVY